MLIMLTVCQVIELVGSNPYFLGLVALSLQGGRCGRNAISVGGGSYIKHDQSVLRVPTSAAAGRSLLPV